MKQIHSYFSVVLFFLLLVRGERVVWRGRRASHHPQKELFNFRRQCDKPIVLESYRQGDSVQRVHGALPGLFLGGHIFLWFPVSSYFIQQALQEVRGTGMWVFPNRRPNKGNMAWLLRIFSMTYPKLLIKVQQLKTDDINL